MKNAILCLLLPTWVEDCLASSDSGKGRVIVGHMGIPSQNEFPQGPEIESIASRLGDTGQ